MNISEFISYEENNQPSFPLFKAEFLKDVQIEDLPLNILFPRNNSIFFDEDNIFKKIKGEENAIAIAKKRGRKAIPKDAKQWDDPNITLKEIIENDLAGAPTEEEIKKNEERIRKIKETKARKKAEREKGATAAATPIEQVNDAFTLALEPLVDFQYAAPQIIFKDGKIIVAQEEEKKKELVIVDNKKPYKLNSMSFRKKNHASKWAPEETRKFFKAIEIFGTDFSLIAKLFPARNRDQIKNKFRKEEKANLKKMDEAINRNIVLAKRPLMDRIRAFNNSVKNGEFAALANNEKNDELRGFDKLERRLSNFSTDSMDVRIMEEIQDIFVKEIRPVNNIGHLDLNLDFEREEVNEAKNGMIEAGITHEIARIEEANANKKQNLLLRLF